jgi:cellulose synthase/poly-beta-1,6-N-acetylglucosamine synthase-like glycosyltransferase
MGMLVPGIIVAFFIAGYGLLIHYYSRGWNRMPLFLPDAEPAPGPPCRISVVIAARNEEENIGACLDCLASQHYPQECYEVVVVDDHSGDGTWEQIQGRTGGKLNLIPLRLADHMPPGRRIHSFKKLAIETAIARATGELILATDADCLAGPEWLAVLSAFHQHQKAKFIAAPVRVEGGHSLLENFQILDFLSLQGITGGSVHRKFHTMCNGANLAYEKKVFMEAGGFLGIDHIASGDDMLLMYKVYKKYPAGVYFLKNREAIVSTQAARTWREFFLQRLRWAGKAGKFEDRRISAVLLFVYLFNLQFPVLAIAAVWFPSLFYVLLVLLLLKLVIEYPFVYRVAKFFGQENRMVYFPWFQPLHIVYVLVIGILAKAGNYAWKGRKPGISN